MPGTDTTDRPPTTPQIVEHFVGPVRWHGTEGFCKCPGEHLHSHKTGTRDCKVYIGGNVPTVTCFHDKCRELVAEANGEIRRVWSLYQPEPDAETLRQAREKAAKKYMLIEQARASKPEIQQKFPWAVSDMLFDDQNTATDADDVKDWQRFLTLYDDADHIWVGEPEHTGHPDYAARWRRVAEWKYLNGPEFPFTCPSVFKRGIWSRSNANVVSTPYLVLEGDDVVGADVGTIEGRAANKDACGAIFRWLREAVGLELKMVVDSGNKSLHGWFKMPDPETLEELRVVLPEVGIDRASFKPSQPMRVPGGLRILKDGTPVVQSILWFGGGK